MIKIKPEHKKELQKKSPQFKTCIEELLDIFKYTQKITYEELKNHCKIKKLRTDWMFTACSWLFFNQYISQEQIKDEEDKFTIINIIRQDIK